MYSSLGWYNQVTNNKMPAWLHTGQTTKTHRRRFDMKSLPKVSGIYKITNTVNGKFYIGSAVNIQNRCRGHIYTLSRGKHKNPHLQSTFNKYGLDVFEFSVLEECNIFMLIIREQFYIDSLSPHYNIARVAGSSLGTKRTPEQVAHISIVSSNRTAETLKKLAEAARGNKNMLGKTHSAESRIKIGNAGKGRIASDESRKKMSDAHKNMSDETRKKMSVFQKARTTTKEHRAKISEFMKGNKYNLGRKASEETRAKMSAANSIAIKAWWVKKKLEKPNE